MAESHPVVLFDGVCNLCNGLVQFAIERDPEKRLRFAPLQSDAGQELLEQYNVPDDPDTMVLVEEGGVALRSTAFLKLLVHLGGVWKVAAVFFIVPARLRDWLYEVTVAQHRYDWFGKRDACMTPSDDVEDRFLTADAG